MVFLRSAARDFTARRLRPLPDLSFMRNSTDAMILDVRPVTD